LKPLPFSLHPLAFVFEQAHAMEGHYYSRPSVSRTGDVVNGKTVGDVLRTARSRGDSQKEAECLRFLRNVAAPQLVGELRYLEIGNEFDIAFIKERSATLLLFASIANALVTGQRVFRFRSLSNCNFVELLDSCDPLTAVGLKEVTDRSILRVLRWAYKEDNLLVLREFECFLASQYGQSLFNEYQILHMANRFDFPHIRIGILRRIRTVEDMEEFKKDENYELQLSILDKELFELRCSIIKDCMEKGVEGNEDLYTHDVRNGCSALSSCLSRYVELTKEEEEEIFEVEDDIYREGFNSEVTGMLF
ncbi:hypothetical protein PMAYCL1PPCAC_06525, partial [Pristionchus mayeri]